MIKSVYWIGVVVLIVGVILFSSSLGTFLNLTGSHLRWRLALNQQQLQQADLALRLQPIGLAMLFSGAIVLIYGALAKEAQRKEIQPE